MIKSTNISIPTLFSSETDLTETYISYQRVLIVFKDLMFKISTNAFLRESVNEQLIKSVKVVSPNPIIVKLMDASIFEIYNDLNRACMKGKRAKSFTQILSLLFTGNTGNTTGAESSPNRSLNKSLNASTGKSILVRLP